MSDPISEERLNDYVDGLLSADETRQVERRLAECSEARSTVRFLRSLREEASTLPTSIEPGRDLWPTIQSRLAPAPLVALDETDTKEPGRPADRRGNAAGWLPSLRAPQWAALASAAMLLVVASSGLTAWMLGAQGVAVTGGANEPTEFGDVVPAAGGALDDLRPVQAEYAVEIEQLLWALHENRDTLDPDTVSTIETNLRVIDRAIRKSREALEEDPESSGLVRMLTSNYRRKLELLQRASRIIEAS